MSEYTHWLRMGEKSWSIVLAAALIIGGIVFQIFSQRDLDAAEERGSRTLSFLQTISQRYDLFAESANIKAYRNILEKNRVLQHYIAPHMIIDDAALAQIAYEQYVDGIMILDIHGNLVSQSTPAASELLGTLLDKQGIRDIVQFPQKSYLGKIYHQGKKYSVAISARSDSPGYLVCFKEYNADSYANLELGDLLEGYHFPLDGAAVIMQNGRVVFQSSLYPEKLTNTNGDTLLQQIRKSNVEADSLQELAVNHEHWYGRAAYYKNYQFYLFFPQHSVYENRFEGMFAIAAVIILMILLLALLDAKGKKHSESKAEDVMPVPVLINQAIKHDVIRVLLVEDNKLSMEIAEFILQGQGLHVLRAFNGEEAVNIFAASKPGEIALIFMDLQMPVLNGFEATEQIRHMARPDSDIPIIALTAASRIRVQQRMDEAGIDACITKPLNVAKMQEAIEKFVHKKEGSQ